MHHTPEPWNRNVSPAWTYPIYASASGDESKRDWIHIAAVLPKNPNAEADLDRIVACVNACAGIEDPGKVIPQLAELLRLACQYLEHPEVCCLPFALDSDLMAQRIRAALKALGGGQ